MSTHLAKVAGEIKVKMIVNKARGWDHGHFWIKLSCKRRAETWEEEYKKEAMIGQEG